MQNTFVRNHCVSAPTLAASTGAGSLTTAMYSAFRFKANGSTSSRVVAADAPSLAGATVVGSVFPNGAATAAGNLANDTTASGSTTIAAQRIYALIADLPDPTTSPLGSPTFFWIAGADFTRARLPLDSDFPLPNAPDQCVVGYWWVSNASSAAFVPGTTNPHLTAGISNVFMDNYAGFWL